LLNLHQRADWLNFWRRQTLHWCVQLLPLVLRKAVVATTAKKMARTLTLTEYVKGLAQDLCLPDYDYWPFAFF